MRIGKPHHVAKGHPRVTPPVTVTKTKGSNAFLLTDGKIWNATHLARCLPVTEKISNTVRLHHTHNGSAARRLPRVKYKPSGTKTALCHNSCAC